MKNIYINQGKHLKQRRKTSVRKKSTTTRNSNSYKDNKEKMLNWTPKGRY